MKIKIILGMLAMFCGSLASYAQSDWQQRVKDELPLLGHRNWIVIVDSAYPLQSSPGVETIDTSADHLAVLDYVLDSLKSTKHIRPIVHTDKELGFLTEQDAPGVSRYRDELKAHLSGLPLDAILHQTLIDRVGETGKSFHVLVLKTGMAIPYTSVFLQLDCKYWSAESEAKLRDRMKAAEHQRTTP
ncbi:RbsD/FucU domain-containing protein [Acidicapsa acidisoli]|uniref:RbsD/FucU domain-containing protein n=1 Tax=Acidicapsa acidisoli TaxID=1615681 RepID=UPI0021DF79D0|nr:RbsD/FucU domain-containing protein [Acidicapsa acidisoli]